MRLLFLATCLFAIITVSAQESNVQAELEKFKIQAAEVHFSEGKYIKAIDEYREVLSRIRSKKRVNTRPLTDEVMYRMARCYFKIEDHVKTEKFLSRIVTRNEENKDMLLLYAKSLLYQDKTEKVLEVLNKLSVNFPDDTETKELNALCKNIIDWKNSPAKILIEKNVEFSGEGDANLPFYKSTTNTMYVPKSRFSKKNLIKQKLPIHIANIVEYKRSYGRWVAQRGLESINAKEADETSIYVSDTIAYFTRCIRNEYKEYACSPMYSIYSGGSQKRTGKVQIMGADNAYNMYYDEETNRLYFHANLPGGKGGFDLWYAERMNDTTFKRPVNVTSVNTNSDEINPFVSRNGTIYFGSNRAGGMGNFDIYKYSPKESKVINMRYPYNSVANDVAISFIREESEGYLVTDRDTRYAKYNVYSFNSKKPSIQGTVICNRMGESLSGAEVTLYHKKGEKLATYKTHHDGFFFFDLENEDDYVVKISHEGYADYKYPVTNKQLSKLLHIKKRVLLPKKDASNILSGIYFKENRLDVIKSRLGLNNLLSILYSNKDKTFKLRVYFTKLDKKENHKMSRQQARSLASFLRSKGMSKPLVTVVGSGGKHAKVNKLISNRYNGFPKIGRRLTPTYISFMPARYHRELDAYNERVEISF